MISSTIRKEINDNIKASVGINVRNNTLQPTTLRDIFETIQKDTDLKQKIEIIREISDQSERQEKKKELLPYFILGTFRENKRLKANLDETSYLIFDYDHLSSDPDQAIQKISEDPRVNAAFHSPSGDGVKIIYRLARPINDPDRFSQLYKYYAKKLDYDLGTEPDKTSDASRACFFSYDPDMYLNPDSECLSIDISDEDLPDNKKKVSREEMLQNITGVIPANNPRTPTLTSIISMFIRLGVDREFALELCKRWNRGNEQPHPDSKIEYTVKDMYDRSWKDGVPGKCENFYSIGQKFCEASIVGDEFSITDIGKDKFYIRVGAFDTPTDSEDKDEKDIKNEYYRYLVKSRHIQNLRRIDYISDVSCQQSYYDFNWDEGVFTVHVPPKNGMVQDNAFIENFLEDLFGQYKQFIKEWLAAFFYTNYKKLPFLILTGERGTGKNTFAESIFTVIPTLSVNIKELGNNFNPYLEKKLVVLDEMNSGGKLQYQELKKLSGQKYAEINKKYAPQYTVQNNLNMIIMSNEVSPVSVSRDEVPTDENNNQFFVYRVENKIKNFDPEFLDKLAGRWYHYIVTELKTVFESLNFDGKRYSISTPITAEEKELFQNGATDLEIEVDKLVADVTSDGVNTISEYHQFLIQGVLPTDYLKQYSSGKITKNSLVQELRKRGYLTTDNAAKYKYINGKRPLSYKLTDQAIQAIQAEKLAKELAA